MARDPLRYFRVEARELLDELGKGALQFDKGAAAPELMPHSMPSSRARRRPISKASSSFT